MDDTISRQAALDAVNIGNLHTGIVDALQSVIKDIPSAEPKRKKGEWVDYKDGKWIYAQCSECKTIHDVQSAYCPTCGADMGGEK